jgi:hypothetical protein
MKIILILLIFNMQFIQLTKTKGMTLGRFGKVFIILTMGISFTFVTGCASPKIFYSGFLKDYSCFSAFRSDREQALSPDTGPIAGADLVYVKEDAPVEAFDKVMLDPVVFHFQDASRLESIQPSDRERLSDALHDALTEALDDAYPIVDEAGPNVLRVRVAITDVVPSNPLLNTLSSISPVGLTISTVKKQMTGSHAGVGQATVEAEILDSQTNERLAAAIDVKSGEKFKVIQGMDRWGHAEDAFRFWAKSLRGWLDKTCGRISMS